MFMFILLGITALIDGHTRTIPIPCNLSIAALWFVQRIWSDLFVAMGTMGVFYVCRILLRGGIGMGDVFLTGAFFMGAGCEVAAGSLCVGLLLFALAGVILLILGRGKSAALPFAPFLFAGYTMIIFMRGVA